MDRSLQPTPAATALADRPTHPHAVAAFTLAICGFLIPLVPSLLAIVLSDRAGHALRNTTGPYRGRGLVVAAFTLGALGVTTAVVLMGIIGLRLVV